jgi:hypothetical protein
VGGARGAGSPLVDVVLLPPVFSAARYDLGDLRTYDHAGREIPYALRVRRPVDTAERVAAKEYNRASGPNDSSELSLDLQREGIEHNAVEVQMPGTDFRRPARLEGSDDGEHWRVLARKNLIDFRSGGQQIRDCWLSYPSSRFRYLRIRVERDPDVDHQPVRIEAVTVQRKVEVPGEVLTLEGRLEPRQAVRANGAPGSAWVIDLGGDNVPCERIEVEIGDEEFRRTYYVEAAGAAGGVGGPGARGREQQRGVRRLCGGEWQRRAGEPRTAMIAQFGEVMASRLKLVVIDNRNQALDVRSVKFSAPARQLVFAPPKENKGGVRLYVGNPKAQAPQYDFAGNLPARLEPPPLRATLGPREDNPVYVPEPLPFTERWPWAIYVVLGSVTVLLGVIIVNLARAAIAAHDAAQKKTAGEAAG